MSVFIIGSVTVTALLWILAASLANESGATKRQVLEIHSVADEGTDQVVYAETRRAA